MHLVNIWPLDSDLITPQKEAQSSVQQGVVIYFIVYAGAHEMQYEHLHYQKGALNSFSVRRVSHLYVVM